MISYEPLWRTMEERNFTTYTLREIHKVSNSTVQRLKKNRHVSTYTLNVLCKLLNCSLSDVAEYIPDEPAQDEQSPPRPGQAT